MPWPGLVPGTCQIYLKLCPPCQSGSSGHWPRYTGYSHFTAIYLKPALVLLLHVCLFPFLGILQFNQQNFIKYLLSDYFVAGTMLGTGHQRMN